MPVEKSTKSVGDVLTAVKRQFGDESGVQINDADIIRWTNDAQREIVDTNTLVNAKVATTDVVAGLDTYSMLTDPSVDNISNITSIRYNGVLLRPITVQQAEEFAVTANDNKTSGIPLAWYYEEGNVVLFPTPTDNVTDGLKIRFTAYPEDVTNSGSMLGIPDSYFNALVQYVISQAYELDENAQMAQMKLAQFEKSLGMRQNKSTNQGSSYPTIRLDGEDAY
ncbi:minor tail protein [Arthrobacter phage Nellie]|uniref:Minor tail protein n=4 Tax=Jasminevirus adat TaxID=2560299 RepID=A0A249XN66_9CAUD|nr:structural protein [Arthrobacter phage Adat]ASZ72594.1 minor tail protein [Arthrobacter phage Adat]ASZ73176.1 minor tail protein [Arthrobacter phage GurgleFerb]ASZ73740.1 minor tail protein [Arthrobacter phage Nellie]AXH43710.1 minor tail protein [Arthrobacter phage Brad]